MRAGSVSGGFSIAARISLMSGRNDKQMPADGTGSTGSRFHRFHWMEVIHRGGIEIT
ncbi:MAG: hypothetical protein LJE91_00260 [Gammaproteobacteria bacterium]|nr:hypothetical protein [Gammaproteobacteria bacterium]